MYNLKNLESLFIISFVNVILFHPATIPHYFFSIKRETLCRSIFHLNGHDLDDYIEDDDGENIQRHVWLRRHVVGGWSQFVIDNIWLYYSALQNKVETKIVGTFKEENFQDELKKIAEQTKKEAGTKTENDESETLELSGNEEPGISGNI